MFTIDSSDVITTSHSPNSAAFSPCPRSPENVLGDLPFTQASEVDDPAWRVLAQFQAARNWNQEMMRTAALAAAYRASLESSAAAVQTDVTASSGGGRSKTIGRESTSTLKAWLVEHIKNPYPSKGEKIMLAVMTRMTLTQVSTWFANARRRLKKDNRVRWRDDDDDDADDADDDADDDASAVAAADGGRCRDGGDEEDKDDGDDCRDINHDDHCTEMKRCCKMLPNDDGAISESARRSTDYNFALGYAELFRGDQRPDDLRHVTNQFVRVTPFVFGLESRTDKPDSRCLATTAYQSAARSPDADVVPLDLHRPVVVEAAACRRSVSPPGECERTTPSSPRLLLRGGDRWTTVGSGSAASRLSRGSSSNSCSSSTNKDSSSKPKIWSVVELIMSTNEPKDLGAQSGVQQ